MHVRYTKVTNELPELPKSRPAQSHRTSVIHNVATLPNLSRFSMYNARFSHPSLIFTTFITQIFFAESLLPP